MEFRRARFLFISSNGAHWGGSEELWSAAAVALAEAGHRVSVIKVNVDGAQPRIRQLRELGCRVRNLGRGRILSRYDRLSRAISPLIMARRIAEVKLTLATFRPDLVVISQGMNFDGTLFAGLCRRAKKPYVLIAQKAGDFYWPKDAEREPMRASYSAALACYFVSEHNRRLTEEQLGMELAHAAVVRNPFLVPWEARSDWPNEPALRLACMGRLYPAEKGQDLLIRVLARDRWRSRAISVTFYGDGHYRGGLEQMVSHYGLTNVTFAGFVEDVASVWTDHHGLILPSRCEGLPLVLVEAMLSGRVPIVTNVAGNSEIVHDGVTGFLAAAATEDAIDDALERAWQRRDEWRAIGAKASDSIRTLVPPDPGKVLAEMLLRVVAVPEIVVMQSAAVHGG